MIQRSLIPKCISETFLGAQERKKCLQEVPHRTDMAGHHLLSTSTPFSLCSGRSWKPMLAEDLVYCCKGHQGCCRWHHPATAPHPGGSTLESPSTREWSCLQLWRWFQDHVAHTRSFAGSRAPTKRPCSLTDDQVSTGFFSKQETRMECSLVREGKILSCLCDVPTA